VANSRTEQIEALTIQHRSLFDVLDEQIDSSLFPTPKSKEAAYFVVANLDEKRLLTRERANFFAN